MIYQNRWAILSFIGIICVLKGCSNPSVSAPVPEVFRSHFYSPAFSEVEYKMYLLNFPAAIHLLEKKIASGQLTLTEKQFAFLQLAFLQLNLEKRTSAQQWIIKFQHTFPDSSTWSNGIKGHYYLVAGMLKYQQLYLIPARTLLEKALFFLQKNYPPNHYYVGFCLNQLGLVHFDIDPTLVLVNEYLQKAEIVFLQAVLSRFQWELYLGQAIQAYNDRSYKKANAAVIEALKIKAKLSFELPIFHARCLHVLGNVLKKQEDDKDVQFQHRNYQEAEACFLKALKLLTNQNSVRIQETYRDLIIVATRFTDYSTRTRPYLSGLVQAIKTQGRDVFGFPDRLQGYILFDYNPAQSIYYYERFLNQNTQNPYHQRHVDEAYFSLARLYQKNGFYEKALAYNQKNIQLFRADRAADKFIPALGYKVDTTQVATWVLTGVNAQLHLSIFKALKQADRWKHLFQSIQVFEEFDQYFFSSILTDEEDAIITYQQQVGSEFYPSAIEACYYAYAHTQDERWFQKAFKFAERQKSYLLYRDMLVHNREHSQQLPLTDSIRALQGALNREYARLNQNPAGGTAMHQIGTLERTLQRAMLRRRIDSTAYHQKIMQPIPTLDAIVQVLGSDKQLLQYILTNQRLFILAVSPHKYAFKMVEDTGLVHAIQALNRSLSGSGIFPSSAQVHSYLDTAFLLYTTLIAPVSHVLSPQKTTIVVPDQALHLLPFEVLLKEEMPTKGMPDFRTLPYLLNDGPILYTPSWKVYAEKNQKNNLQQDHAPIYFWAAADVLHGDVVQKTLHQLFQDRLKIEVCQKVDFMQALKHARGWMHLSVHAESSLVDRLNNKLKFLAQPEEAGLLYGFDIASYDLSKVDLIVLAACQSNLGQTGQEGAFSLTRSFLQAGAKQVVGTLWQVDDGTTHQLLSRMYQKLKAKLSPEKALWLAKKDWLRSGSVVFPGAWGGVVAME